VKVVGGEAELEMREHEGHYHTEGDGIAVGHGRGATQGERLEGMCGCMAEVERTADAAVVEVAGDHPALHVDALAQERQERIGLVVGNVVAQEAGGHLARGYEAVLDHLGIAREELLRRESAEEGCRDYHHIGLTDNAYLVFQAVEVYAGLASYGSVDGAEKRCGNINERYAALEGGGSEGSEIGYGATADVD